MKSSSRSASPTTAPRHARHAPSLPPALAVLAAACLVLLAIGLCVRPLISEQWGTYVASLLETGEAHWSASPSLLHAIRLITAGGIGLAAIWVALTGRRWRGSGLEIGAAILMIAACLAVPVASDKRMAINTAMDVILPLLAAAALYQLLVYRPSWRRVVLASLIAVAAANCYEVTAKRFWEYPRIQQQMEENPAAALARVGLSPQHPAAGEYRDIVTHRISMGYFHHANVLAALLSLGAFATLTALLGWWPRRESADPAAPSPGRSIRSPTTPLPSGNGARRSPDPAPESRPADNLPARIAPVPAIILAALLVWLLVAQEWIRSAGAGAGILAAVVLAPVTWYLAGRRKVLAAGVLLAALLLLQAGLTTAALDAPQLRRDWAGQESTANSLAVRLSYWQGCLDLFAGHPLAGVGPGQFPTRYPQFKSIEGPDIPSHPHNWLLTMAAEWGVLGVAGLAIALGAAGWRIIRSLSEPAAGNAGSRTRALLPALLIVLGCWLAAASDAAPGARIALLPAAAVSLVAAACAALSGLANRSGQVILLGGAIAFLVHATVSPASGAPAAVWPFWMTVAVAMAWKATGATPDGSRPAGSRVWSRAMLAVVLVAVIATFALITRPLRAAGLMEDARKALAAHQPDRALELFAAAAETDPLDPLPARAAAMLNYRLAQQPGQPPRRVAALYAAAVERNELAVQRDPYDHAIRRALALSRMYLATATWDFSRVRLAVKDMQEALRLHPEWPAGWMELAQMAAAEPAAGVPDDPELLRLALDAAQEALTLDQRWAPRDTEKLQPAQRAQMEHLQDSVRKRLARVE